MSYLEHLGKQESQQANGEKKKDENREGGLKEVPSYSRKRRSNITKENGGGKRGTAD